MDSLTIHQAHILWDYMSSFDHVQDCDALVVCCSYDLRVCDHACDLIKSGLSDCLVLSGHTGNWTRHMWKDAEALIFKQRAIDNGIDAEQIVCETRATNFGENISLSCELLPDAESVMFVSKPNSLLRVKLTVEAQWPEVRATVTAPRISFPEQVSNVVGVLGVIEEMVGDIERIQTYPSLGYQTTHELPGTVIDAWNYLIDQGFTNHMAGNR